MAALFSLPAAALLATTLLPATFAQDNTSYVNYNVEPQPNLYPETLAWPRIVGMPDCNTGPLSHTVVCNSSVQPYERAAGLIELFTLEELLAHSGNTIPSTPRLGLPNYEVWSECLHGLDHANFSSAGRWSWSTSFPQAILTASSLNRTLFNTIGDIVATQARAFNNDGRYGLEGYDPNINGFRSPVWGRGQETPGEDTYCLTSQYAYQYITGLQGGVDPATIKLGSTAKHFAGYDIENWHNHSRLGNDLIIPPQDLSEYYMPQFRVAVQDAKVHSVMCAYVAVNGVPSCANSYFLQTLLRDTWGFSETSYVASDCDAVYVIWNPHEYAANWTMAAADGIRAGCDSNCGQTYQRHLIDAYEYVPPFLIGVSYSDMTSSEGLVARRDIERSVTRLYAMLIRAGYFDGDSTEYRGLGWSDVVSSDARNISYEAAVQGIVMLKNDGTLPLDKSNSSIAVVGPLANATNQMQGNYYGPAPYLTSPLDAFQASGYHINYAFGTNISSTNDTGFSAAIDAAKKSDIVVYIGGIDNTIEAEGLDREYIGWPGMQLDLIARLAELGKPVVVVTFGGGQVDDSTLKSNPNVNAIMWVGYPAQSGGAAILDIITGARAPAGRLSATQYPKDYINRFSQLDMGLRPNSSEGNPGQTYAWYTGTPVYSFGHGLFYTTFQESASKKNSSASTYNIATVLGQSHPGYMYAGQEPLLNFTAQIMNTGNRTSDYTAMLFVNTSDAGPSPYPNKWLVGFDRMANLSPGHMEVMTIPVPIEAFGRIDEMGNRVVYPGHYELALNNDRSVVMPVTLKGNQTVILEWPLWEQQVTKS